MKIVILERNSIGSDVSIDDFAKIGELTVYDNTNTEKEAAVRIRDAEAVIANKAPLTKRVLSYAPDLKFIGILATGYDNCDIDYCRAKGIRVTNVRDYSTAMVAQHTITLALALTQKLSLYDRYVRSGQYADSDSFSYFSEPFSELDGKTWGIVGMGNIGSRVARIAQALGCEIITHSLTQRTGGEYRIVDKKTLLENSDILSLHCPLTELSRGFIDRAALMQMKRTAVLINVARGPIVDEAALCEAVECGQIGGAGLDVLSKEPMAKDNVLRRLKDSDRLIITPHLAWASIEARKRCVEGVRQNLLAFMNGEERNVIC